VGVGRRHRVEHRPLDARALTTDVVEER